MIHQTFTEKKYVVVVITRLHIQRPAASSQQHKVPYIRLPISSQRSANQSEEGNQNGYLSTFIIMNIFQAFLRYDSVISPFNILIFLIFAANQQYSIQKKTKASSAKKEN